MARRAANLIWAASGCAEFYDEFDKISQESGDDRMIIAAKSRFGDFATDVVLASQLDFLLLKPTGTPHFYREFLSQLSDDGYIMLCLQCSAHCG